MMLTIMEQGPLPSRSQLVWWMPSRNLLPLWWWEGSPSVQKETAGHVVSRHSISATWGPRDIISLIIHKMGITQLMTISTEHLPLFSFSLYPPCHLLLTRQVLNQAIREDIYRLYIQVTWTSPSTSLGLKMFFYLEHFLELRNGIIISPPYTCRHWMHSLRIPFGQLWVRSHRLLIETNHHIPWFDRIC
jgi:hypothetical protein